MEIYLFFYRTERSTNRITGDSDYPFPGRVLGVRRYRSDGRKPTVVQGWQDESADHTRRSHVHAQRQHAHAVL